MNEPLLFEHSGWALCNETECDSANFSALAFSEKAKPRGLDNWIIADGSQHRGQGQIGAVITGDQFDPTEARDGSCLTHVGCESRFPNWHLSVMLWDVYRENSENRLICPDCRSVLPKEAYEIFCKVYNLLNRQ